MNQIQKSITLDSSSKLFDYFPELDKFVIVSTILNTKISKNHEYKRDTIFTMKKSILVYMTDQYQLMRVYL